MPHGFVDVIRRCVFSPYRRGHGPTFTLTLGDAKYGRDRYRLRAVLTMREHGRVVVLFDDATFGPSPCHAWDSNDCIKAIMGFFTLRPGDTDAEYFDDYTPAQFAYCAAHAEALDCCVHDRFGWDD